MIRFVVLLAVMLAPALDRSAFASPPIVIESYTGTRPDNTGRLLGPVFDELAARGFAVGYDGVGRGFERGVSRASRTEDGVPGDFADQVERGHDAWIAGRFEDAIAILSPLIEVAHGNSAAVSQDATLRREVRRALFDLALAHQRNGDPPAAAEAMGELLRSFPELTVTRASHGPEAFKLYDATRRQLATRGTLVVEVVDSATQIFLDEQYAKNGPLRRTDLYPGTYRVYAAKGDLEGRTYAVAVAAGTETRITIDVGLDAMLHVDPTWSGLAFTTAEERDALEPGYAASFAKLVGADAVAVVGIDTVRGRRALVGSLISLDTGREIRRASLAIAPEPSSDRRRALARFLAGDDSAKASLDVDDPAAEHRHRGGSASRWGALKYVVTGVGLAAGGVGGYLLSIDGGCKNDTNPCAAVHDTAVSGWASVGGGVALVGLGIYMFATDTKAAEHVTLAPTRGGAMAFIRFRF